MVSYGRAGTLGAAKGFLLYLLSAILWLIVQLTEPALGQRSGQRKSMHGFGYLEILVCVVGEAQLLGSEVLATDLHRGEGHPPGPVRL